MECEIIITSIKGFVDNGKLNKIGDECNLRVGTSKRVMYKLKNILKICKV